MSAAGSDKQHEHKRRRDVIWETAARLGLLYRVEKKLFGHLGSYALAIGVLSLIVPLTIQELVNTFAYAIQPIMIATLAGIMMLLLLFMGAFRVLQARAIENLSQRLYTRLAVAFTLQLPRFRTQSFRPKYTNYFAEAENLTRAIAMMLVEIMNIVVGGVIGMTILVLYHPYFLFFNFILVGGFAAFLIVLGRGGFLWTVKVSEQHYDLQNWLQEIAQNLFRFKATASTPLLLKKTDELAKAYVEARKVRADILTGRQYKGTVIWQAVAHGGLIAMAGWLLAANQIMLGQFVAANVIVGNLLLHLDTVTKRMQAVFYTFTSLSELAFVFSLPKDVDREQAAVPIPDPLIHGIRLTGHDLSFSYPESGPVFQHVNLEVAPGEKIAIFSPTSLGKTTLAKVLAGLDVPTSGFVRYNSVDLRDADRESLNACRSIVMDSQLSLFDGTLEENITLGRPSISYEDIYWTLRFVELEEEVDALPLGLKTPVKAGGRTFTTSQILRILVASAIVIRPQILIFDGTLHSMNQTTREAILRRLCSKEEPWSVVFVSNDPALHPYVDRRLILE